MKVQLTGVLAGHTLFSDGTVIKDSTGCQLKQWDSGEYKSVCINGFTTMVHNLMGRIYLADSYVEGYVVNHKDLDKHNNHYSNLEWITREENTKHGMTAHYKFREKKPDYIPRKRQIVMLDLNLNEISRYHYISEVESVLNLGRRQISKIIAMTSRGEVPTNFAKKYNAYIVWEDKIDNIKKNILS